MNDLTTIERRAMQRISTDRGNMFVIAADQRNSMKAVVQDVPEKGITAVELAVIKADLVRHLANHAPAILLDPEVALPGVVDDRVLTRDTALVVGMDSSGADVAGGLKYTNFVPGITARQVRDFGGDAAKMLYYTRPDLQQDDARLLRDLDTAIADCEREGVLLIVELLTYRLEDESEDEYQAKFADLVADGARLAVKHGSKVLKLQFPGSAEGCRAVADAAAGLPWAVLSAGVDHETFVGQVRVAMASGASGAMAGRSLWKDALSFDPIRRKELLTGRALPRLHELQAAVDGL
ncbi:MAG: tagatose-bisphosphate aldolase [Microbacteriaceae bacterium]|nr:MAG: tagatose-bisphosphate aldolase [Microbacteriaceae bacterium]